MHKTEAVSLWQQVSESDGVKGTVVSSACLEFAAMKTVVSWWYFLVFQFCYLFCTHAH